MCAGYNITLAFAGHFGGRGGVAALLEPLLLNDGIPADAEHAMVAKSRGRADSPAAAAARKKSTARKAPAKRSSPRAGKHKARTSR